MNITHPKITARRRVSGKSDTTIVRREGRYTSEDIHRVLFPNRARRSRSVEQMKAGVRTYVKKRLGRG